MAGCLLELEVSRVGDVCAEEEREKWKHAGDFVEACFGLGRNYLSRGLAGVVDWKTFFEVDGS